MHYPERTLLIIDGVINLLLGALLLCFPLGIAAVLGVPSPAHAFYATLLGAVLFGIGVALLIDVFGAARGLRGLGMAGAIAINFCGAGALVLWLIVAPPDIPLRGRVLLWSIAIVVLTVGLVEMIVAAATKPRSGG
jgi:hypothetical protein